MTEVRPTRDELPAEAIHLLTHEAHHTTDSDVHLDLGHFLAHVLAATAANLRGPERPLAARPGSWEISHLDALLRGTVGDQPYDWNRYRTEPLIVPLNVAELVEDPCLHPDLLGLDNAIEAIDLRYVGADEDDATLDAWGAEVDALSQRYETEYRAYADRFSATARILGRALTPPIDVRVIADTRPAPRWWDETAVANPTGDNSDPLAVALWCIAHDTVPLPTVETRPPSADQSTDED